jgi:hypothetical protein
LCRGACHVYNSMIARCRVVEHTASLYTWHAPLHNDPLQTLPRAYEKGPCTDIGLVSPVRSMLRVRQATRGLRVAYIWIAFKLAFGGERRLQRIQICGLPLSTCTETPRRLLSSRAYLDPLEPPLAAKSQFERYPNVRHPRDWHGRSRGERHFNGT